MDGSRNPDSDAIVNDASIGSIIGPAVIDTDMAEQFAADLGITMEQFGWTSGPIIADPGAGFLANLRSCDIYSAMNVSKTRYFFWYYEFPKPLAEEGIRSV